MSTTSRAFTCTEAGSSKFWIIVPSADGKSFNVTFGKIGTAGQSKEKSFPTTEACTKEIEKLIREKTGKGYIEQQIGTANAAPVAKPATTAQAPQSASSIRAPKAKAPAITAYDSKDIPQTRAFLRAIRAGKLDLVRAYLDAGADPAQRIKENQRTDAYPVHAAALANQPEVLRELISRATHYRTSIGSGYELRRYSILPLIACLEDDIDRAATVQLLLDCGYDVARDSDSILVYYTNMRLPEPLLAEILKRTSLDFDKGNYFYLAFDYGQKYSEEIRAIAPERVLALIDRGIKIKDTPDTDSLLTKKFGSPLHLALTYAGKNLQLIEKLIDAGADLTVKNTKQIVTGGNALTHIPQKLTPLELAESGTIKVSADVLALLRKHTAPSSNDLALAKLDPRDKRLLVLSQTPFETASNVTKQVDEIRKLLKEGANPNVRDVNGLTPLHHLAAQNHYHHTLALLADFITAGADINARDNEERTPIFHIQTGYAGILSLYRNFIAVGADINARDNHQHTPAIHRIHASADNDQESINDTLRTHLAAGADPRLATPDGDTLLHHAARADIGFEAEELIAAALAKGADLNAKNQNGLTPLHIAVSQPVDDRTSSHDDILRALLDAGADINAQTTAGDTAIHLAAHPDDDYDILIEARPNLTLKNQKGISAFDHIKALGYHDPAEHRSLTRSIDALMASAKAPDANTPPPAIAWTPHPIDITAPLPEQLRITSSLIIKNNDADVSLTHLGGNLLGIAGGKPSSLAAIDIVDTAAGKVIWHMDGYEDYRQPSPIYDDAAIYLPRYSAGSRSLTAHKPDTGEQLWQCKLGNSYMQFADGLVQTATHIIHANPDTGKLYIIDKKNGKLLTRAPLANQLGEWGNGRVFTAGDKLYALAINKKKRIRVLDEYDPVTGAHKSTLAELGGMDIAARHVHNGRLYLLDDDGLLHKINLGTGKIEKSTKALPDYDDDVRCSKHLNASPDGKLHYYLLASTDDDNPFVYCVYDLATDRVTTHDLSHMDTTFERYESRATTHDSRLLRIEKRGKPSAIVQLFDAAKCAPITTLTFPNYGGETHIEHIHHIGNALYIAQHGGRDHGKEHTVLHCVQ